MANSESEFVNSYSGSDVDSLQNKLRSISKDDFKNSDRQRPNDNSVSDIDPQEYLFEKKQSLDHFFYSVYEQLSKAPFAMPFYLSLPKFMVRQDTHSDKYFELMRKTLKNITDDEIDLFLYYDTESAISIVKDLTEG